MARRIPVANGVRSNGDAPPSSTLAAQIVQNRTRVETTSSQQNGNSATFTQLLQEILTNSAAIPETDVQINVKLISVVAEAGLDVLTRDDPFPQWDILIPQATDSITVIEATVQRQPEVLLAPISNDGPPLILWLLARLTAVWGRPQCRGLPVRRLLESAVQALNESIDLWQYAATLQQVIEDCIEGM